MRFSSAVEQKYAVHTLFDISTNMVLSSKIDDHYYVKKDVKAKVGSSKSAKEFLIAKDALKVDFDKKAGGTGRSKLHTHMFQFCRPAPVVLLLFSTHPQFYILIKRFQIMNFILRRGVGTSVFW